jgi:LysM repeat protein
MKRRTRLISIGCAVVGTFPIAAQAASASTNEPQTVSLHEKQSLSLQASRPTPGRVRAVHSSAVPPQVQAPLERVTVNPGDTLSAIGTRTSRTWEQLAGYNHISNPDLIYADQIIIIPPANYVAAVAPTPSPVVVSTREVSETPRSVPTSHTYSASVTPASTGQASGIWGCIGYHESGNNPSTNTGNGYYGMYQDTQSSWAEGGGLAYAPRADLASGADQTIVNERIQAQQGWGAWPVSSVACGA